MTTKDEALKQALDALEYSKSYLDELADVHGTSKKAKPGSTAWNVDRAITACRAALEPTNKQQRSIMESSQDTNNPVAWVDVKDTHRGPYEFHGIDYMPEGKHPLYIAPPKRQPLTDEKLRAMWANYAPIVGGVLEFARAIEKAHGIGVDHDA